MRTGVIVVAGGSGSRMGTSVPKQFLPLAGRPVLVRTLERIGEALPAAPVVVVLPETHIGEWLEICRRCGCAVGHAAVAGGATRFDSVAAGIAALPDDCDLIAVHDGVRPLLSAEMILRGVECAAAEGAAVPVVPMVDSIREIDPEGGSHAVDRGRLRAVQTPQIFDARLLRAAYDAAAKSLADRAAATDDASVVEMYGRAVALYEGERSNIKITTPTDMAFAEALTHE